MSEGVEDLDLPKAAPVLETFREQVACPAALRCSHDESVPISKLGGIYPVPGLADQSQRCIDGPPMRQIFYDLACAGAIELHLAYRIPVNSWRTCQLIRPAPAIHR